MSVNETLKERGSRYGSFKGHSTISQNLKNVMYFNTNWVHLQPAHKEALDMIVHKIARILNGDSNYKDSWHDIAGYATLAESECVELESIKEETDPLDR